MNQFVIEIFLNLLSNAIKYSPQENKKIEVEIKVIIQDEKEFCKISVGDYGLGIPDELKEEIFNRLDTEIKHSGIGLSLTKILVERFKGKIWVEDRNLPEKGSIFNVILPVTE